MSSEDKNVRTIWQQQPIEEMTMSVSDLNARARAFVRRVRSRNIILYLYSLLNIVAGGALIYLGYFPLMKYPMILMIAAHLFVLWQVVFRARARRMDDAVGHSGVGFLREQYERQRQALSTAWLWYILPFMPALLWELAIWYGAIQTKTGDVAATGQRNFLIVVAGAVVFWGIVWLLFANGARRWRGKIAELDRVAAE